MFGGKIGILHAALKRRRCILNVSTVSLMTCFDVATCEDVKTLQTILSMLFSHFGGWGWVEGNTFI